MLYSLLISKNCWGKWKEETSGGQVQWVTECGLEVVYFFLVRLREKNIQFTRGTIMIQVQSVSVLFPVAKYWLCFIAADGLNGECRLCWKEWVSVRATSGPSCAQWTWLLHQAASLELAGALGAFCHSSHCSSAPIKSLICHCAKTEGPYNVLCRQVLHIPPLSLHSAWVTYSHIHFTRRELWCGCCSKCLHSTSVHSWLSVKLPDWWDVACTTPVLNWHWK